MSELLFHSKLFLLFIYLGASVVVAVVAFVVVFELVKFSDNMNYCFYAKVN